MQTIIQNSFILQYYPYKSVDQKILDLFDDISNVKTKVNFIKRALNVYLNITNQKLSFLDLSSDRFKKIIDDSLSGKNNFPEIRVAKELKK